MCKKYTKQQNDCFMSSIRMPLPRHYNILRLNSLLLALFLFLSVHSQQLRSPNGRFLLDFSLTADGTATYHLSYKGKEIIKPSTLGLALKNDSFSLLNGFVIADSARNTVNSS